MKKLISLFLLTALLCMLCSCILFAKPVESMEIGLDCDAFSNPEDIMVKATNVYEGKVTKRYFDTLNVETLLPDTNGNYGKENEGDANVRLFIIYEIEVQNTFKGIEKEKRTIIVRDGTDDFGVNEQYAALNKANIEIRYVNSQLTDVKVGNTYLFVTMNDSYSAELDTIYNPMQFAYDKKNKFESYGVNYDRLKSYIMSNAYNNIEQLPIKYYDSDKTVYNSAKEIVDNAIDIFEGVVYKVDFSVLVKEKISEDSDLISLIDASCSKYMKDPKLYTKAYIAVKDEWKGKQTSGYPQLYIESGLEGYGVSEQIITLNKLNLKERNMITNLNEITVGKTYLFVTIKQEDNVVGIEPANPAQFAFATDDSNALGGVTYSMIKEYLKK